MNTIIDPLVVALVVLTSLGVLWRLKRRKKSGCGGGCGCTPNGPDRKPE